MKKVAYILFIFCVVACKQNNAMQTESKSVEMLPTMTDDFHTNKVLSSEALSIKKLEEYIDLIKLKQVHPEFEDDITLQLNNFTTSNKSAFDYPEGFNISNIEQLGMSKMVSDTIEQFVLGYTVTVNTQSFKDSMLTQISSKAINIDGDTLISKNVKFIEFENY
nr:hypothetical protein [uncultured Psychroserpens sp.]